MGGLLRIARRKKQKTAGPMWETLYLDDFTEGVDWVEQSPPR